MKYFIFILGICATTWVSKASCQLNDYCCSTWEYLKIAPIPTHTTPARFGQEPVLLQLKSEVSQEYLRGLGVVLRVLDDKNFIMLPHQKNIINEGNFYSVKPLWKLGQGALQWFNTAGQTKIVLGIKFTKEIALPKEVLDKVLLHNAAYHYYEIRLSPTELAKLLAAYKEIEMVNRAEGKATPEAILQDNDLTLNQINVIHNRLPGLNGAGQVISVKENRISEDDIDLRGRLVAFFEPSDKLDKHAADMATYIAGAANSSPQSRGALRAAQISNTSFVDKFPTSYFNYFGPNNIYLQNHSYGIPEPSNNYSAEAQAYDNQVYEYPQLIHVFSVGNTNTSNDTPNDGPYSGIKGFANLTGSLKQAKNIIVVGSVDSVLRLVDRNSSGPAYDGRIKPDLVAYSVGGSSNSAAIVSGTVGLLQHYYRQNYSSAYPDVALIKSVLITSAQDVGRPGPDFNAGYGNILADRALKILENKQFVKKTILQSGINQATTITLPANAKNLRVSLVWVDQEANIGDSKALKQDLDLQLKSPTNELILPWVLDSTPNAESLLKPATRGEDHLNVVEQVTLAAPQAGTYSILVNATDLPFGAQDYYLSWQWDIANSFTFTYPTAKDNAPLYGERPPFIRWQSTYPEGTTGVLEYKLNSGAWQMLNNAVSLDKTFKFWPVPDTVTLGQVRITVAGKVYESGIFTVGKQLRPSLGFNCADSILIQWKKKPDANSYNIYSLGDKYLELLKNTADTILVLKKNQLDEGYYAVAPVLDGAREAAHSLLYNFDNQGGECYVPNLFVSREEFFPDLLKLRAEIGTTYQVEEIVFERLTANGSFEPIDQRIKPTYTTLELNNIVLQLGKNVFRVKLVLSNGTIVYSEPQEIFAVEGILVTLNPINRVAEYLNIKTRAFNQGYVRLLDMTGKQVFIQSLNINTYQHDIAVERVNPGLYVVEVILDGERYTQKAIIY